MSRKTLAWLLVVGYCGFIFFLSAQSNPLPLLTAHIWDKALHFTEYATLGALLALAFGVWDQPTNGWRVALAILCGALYGASDELHQSFVPGRDAEVGDAVADALGTSLGVGALWLLATLQSRRLSAATSRIGSNADTHSG